MKKVLIHIVIAIISIVIVCMPSSDHSDEASTMSCYDYIMQTMQEPQYWNEEQMVEYSTKQMQTAAREALINGTGWKLVEDGSDIIFKRGYQGELWLNFTQGVAFSYFTDEFQLWPSKKAYRYDLINKKVTLVDLDDDSKTIDITSEMIRKNASTDMRFNIYEAIEKTFNDYNDAFNGNGCPIINSGKDILEDYKDKSVTSSDEQENLLDQPFPWLYKDHIKDDLIPLTNMEEIFTLERAEYTDDYLKYKTSDGKDNMVYYYNPLFVLFKDNASFEKYKLKDPYSSSYFEHTIIYDDLISDFVMIYGNEVCKQIYDGEGCVYWIDSSQHPSLQKGTVKPFFGLDASSIKDLSINKDTVLTLYYHPDDLLVGNVLVNDLYQDIVYRTFAYLNEVLAYYGKTIEVDDDYLETFILYYNLDWQRMLGLR